MTIGELLSNSADKLEKLSEAELVEILAPLFPKCRPALVQETVKKTKHIAEQKTFEDLEKKAKIEKAKALLRQKGFNI
jgi:hypothetical protein